MRCREGSIILLRLCAALEAFDLAIDNDQSGLNGRPRWPILEGEEQREHAAAEAAAAIARENLSANPNYDANPNAFRNSNANGGGSSSGRGSAGAIGLGGGFDRGSKESAPQGEEESWFNQQRKRQEQEREEEGKWRPTAGGWAASALSEIDQVWRVRPILVQSDFSVGNRPFSTQDQIGLSYTVEKASFFD